MKQQISVKPNKYLQLEDSKPEGHETDFFTLNVSIITGKEKGIKLL